MWRTDGSKAYPFRHKHPNHFPPSPRGTDTHLSTCFEDHEANEEFPIVFMMPEYHPRAHNNSSSSSSFDIVLTTPTPTERKQRDTMLTSMPRPNMPSVTGYFASKYLDGEEDISTPPIPMRRRPSLNLRPLSIPPRGPIPTSRSSPQTKYHSSSSSSSSSTPTIATPIRSRRRRKDAPPTPSSQAPEKMTDLLTEVLNIMNTVMEQQHSAQEEDAILGDLTELVVIMQEEAEALLHLADVVEEYVEEVDLAKEAAEIEDWVEELGLDEMPEVSDGSGSSTETELDVAPILVDPEKQSRNKSHARDDSYDSALGLEDEGTLGHTRNPSEIIHQAAVVQIAQVRKTESEARRGNLVEIGRRAMERSEGMASAPQTPRTPKTPQISRTPLSPRAFYVPYRKPSIGLIKVDKAELWSMGKGTSKGKGKSRKAPPPPLSPFRDSGLVMSPNSSLRSRPLGRNDRGIVLSPRWI
ncbi:hypothetical protein ONS95_012125 [Cadophora gregata]|uniref:uncharacterized protein n=1 Tax=Cadophora gregata TaxID=51156 RepID=UPI0026DAE86D|nr:uncharacterized protein ONS95_012125 [Cadophora gregata]KAK0117800.1 hypothetical protein ONS95_012125 [Cadophora gregata]KAK0122854.1 hypothetical protein ONS96_009881 [Cadophora gregata f. sp. sojae]